MKRFATRLLAYGAAAIPCAVFLAMQGHGDGTAATSAREATDPAALVTTGFPAEARPLR